ncbi:MAG TPA: type II toxin-antitoxin system HicA family toxin [Solirubrobacteraceae bacterium]|nr:type II toxin-antitoxin system HicA family toxin [Solirubrobacteraceae bacterium]
MPKKYREVRRTLRRAGWLKIRQAGSHEIWESPDRNTVVTVAGKDSDTAPPVPLLRCVAPEAWTSFDD